MTTTATPSPSEIIQKAIGMNAWQYENLQHQNFVLWCEVIAEKFYYKERNLIINESLLKYYKRQWQILVENLFVKDNSAYLEAEIQAKEIFLDLIYHYADELVNYYPASLLKSIKEPKKPKLILTFNHN